MAAHFFPGVKRHVWTWSMMMLTKSTKPTLFAYLEAKAKAEKATDIAAKLSDSSATAAKTIAPYPENAIYGNRANHAAKLADEAVGAAVKALAEAEAEGEKIRPSLKSATAENLLPLAAKLPDEPSLASCKDALRLAGLPIKLFRDLQTVSGELFRTRRTRRSERSSRCCRKGNGRPAVVLPAGTPQQRLDAKTRSEVWSFVVGAARFNTRHKLEIRLSTDGVVDAGTDKVFDGRAGNWTIYRYDTTVTVPRDWLRTVKAQGIAEIGDFVILKAGRLQVRANSNGIVIAPVVYLAQGAGANVAAKEGFAAKSGEFSCVAPTEAGAIRRMKTMIVRADAKCAAEAEWAESCRVDEVIRKAECAARARAEAEAEEIRLAASAVLDDGEAEILAGLWA